MVFWVSVIGCVYLLYFPTIAVIKGTSFNATVRSNMVDNTVRFISLRRSSVSFDGFCHYCIRLPGFIKRIRRPITNAPLLTFDAMMSKDIKSKPAPEFPENIFHGFAGLRVQFDIVLMFIIPREDLAQITFRPAEGPPVAEIISII